ncbi:MAG: toxin-antitoxin system HicB family antitoxin [Deltaproteobacteria bacterium]|nr:toxin-antitoxin system HicB family antitoxin [Deltaproteobacteria bacterium]
MPDYSGKFLLRMPESLHARLAAQAARAGISLNAYCLQRLSEPASRSRDIPVWRRAVDARLPTLKKRFGENLIGVAAFGSQVRNEATSGSDVDLLVVLSTSIPLSRSLYRWWEESEARGRSAFEINPHFVHLPEAADQAGSLWLETALRHELIYQSGTALERFLQGLLDRIESGKIYRKWSNGHPYWVRSDHEK